MTTQIAPTEAEVEAALEQYLTLLNTSWKPEGYRFRAQQSGRNWRIIDERTDHLHNVHESVHAFVNRTTGDLFKAAGWKVAAPGVRYNIVTEFDLVQFAYTHRYAQYETGSEWAGGYLYADQCKQSRAIFESIKES